MKKLFLLKQVCGLCIGVAGALVPLGSARAADDYADRYLNGYLNDPYTNEVAPNTQSVLHSDARGAQGPLREDTAASTGKPMWQEKTRRDVPPEAYMGYSSDTGGMGRPRGAQGPIRSEAPMSSGKPMGTEQGRIDPPQGDWFNPPYPKAE